MTPRLLTLSVAFALTPWLQAQSSPENDSYTPQQKIQLTEKQGQIEEKETELEAARAKHDSLKHKTDSQEEYIAELKAAIERKEQELSGAPQAKSSVDDIKANGLPVSFLAEVTDKIVIIEGNKGNGTGFLCKSDGEVWVYTAAHVLSGNSTISVRDSKGVIYSDFDFMECADGVDLVRLKLSTPSLEGLDLVPAEEAPEIGDTIVAVGNSLGAGSLSGEPGKVMSIQDNMWEVDAEIIPGNSGGPVLDLDSGKVIGIVTHLTIPKRQQDSTPSTMTKVKRFAARLDKEWEWDRMPVSRFVKEWRHIERMDTDSSIAWASIYLMHTGPEEYAASDPRMRANVTTKPEVVRYAESLLSRHRQNFQVQRVHAWLKRYRAAGKLQKNELIDEGNAIIKRNLEEIRLKKGAPEAKDFSWYHRQKFEEELEWRESLTE